MSFFTTLCKPQPERYCLRPRNPEAYKKAFDWLMENDPLDILDSVNNEAGFDVEDIYREFSSVYSNNTDIHDFPGTYSPMGWGERAVFAYGYLMGQNAVKGGGKMSA